MAWDERRGILFLGYDGGGEQSLARPLLFILIYTFVTSSKK